MIPTNTHVSVKLASALDKSTSAVAVLITEKSRDIADALAGPQEKGAAASLIGSRSAKGKAREVTVQLVANATGGHRHLFLAGVGPTEKTSAEVLRQAGAAIARAARKLRLSGVTVLTPSASGIKAGDPGDAASVDAIVTGFLLASFDYQEYKGSASKKKADDAAPKHVELTLLTTEKSDRVDAALRRAVVMAEAQNFARTIATRPGNDINPPALAKVAGEMAREVGLAIKILDEKQMAKLGMGGILAVGRASAHPPRMIILEHKPSGSKNRKSAPLLVVGKAITFDTGGISIKPADKMGRMVFDKCGAMAVLGLMCAVAKLKLPIHVVGILSSAENTLSGDAYRPGDILRMYNGVTVEVTNTDAEGRLVLGDALAWGIETYKPSSVVDLATLTGGVVVALGKLAAGVMSNNDGLMGEIQSAADAAGEKIWRLPLFEEYKDLIKSEFADIVNSGIREAHPIQGGVFLSHFIPTEPAVPWAHIDIAGTADTDKELGYYGKGATGWGVRTLVEWVERASAKF